jgi:hypothetical protein
MLVFHAFTWSMKTEGLFAAWALALLVGLALFRKRECIEVLIEPLPAETPMPIVETKQPQYAASFAGYGLRG